jgi:hypothetical protein
MEIGIGTPPATAAAVYDRVVRDARKSFGPVIGEDAAEQAARNAVDDLLVRRSARVTTFVPVLAMRQIRESIDAEATPGD